MVVPQDQRAILAGIANSELNIGSYQFASRCLQMLAAGGRFD